MRGPRVPPQRFAAALKEAEGLSRPLLSSPRALAATLPPAPYPRVQRARRRALRVAYPSPVHSPRLRRRVARAVWRRCPRRCRVRSRPPGPRPPVPSPRTPPAPLSESSNTMQITFPCRDHPRRRASPCRHAPLRLADRARVRRRPRRPRCRWTPPSAAGWRRTRQPWSTIGAPRMRSRC